MAVTRLGYAGGPLAALGADFSSKEEQAPVTFRSFTPRRVAVLFSLLFLLMWG